MKKKAKIPRSVPGLSQITAGPPISIECGGKTWKVGYNVNNAKAALEELIRSHVLKEARKDGPEEYQETRSLIYGGYYQTLNKGWVQIINTPIGVVLLLQSLLLKHQPDATADDATNLLMNAADETADALEQVCPDFFGHVGREWATEKKLTPADAEKIAAEVTGLMRKQMAAQATATA